ncbi:MAG: energy transducer TonB [Cyanobacteria bacterium J06642_2]
MTGLAERRRQEEQHKTKTLALWLAVSALLHVLLPLLAWSCQIPVLRSILFLLCEAPKPEPELTTFTIVDPSDLAPPPEADLQANDNSQDAGEAQPELDPSAGRPAAPQAAAPDPLPAPPVAPAPPPRPVSAAPPPPPEPVAVTPPQPIAPPPPLPEPVVPPEPIVQTPPQPPPPPAPVEPPEPVPEPVREDNAIALATPRPTPPPTPRPTATPIPQLTPLTRPILPSPRPTQIAVATPPPIPTPVPATPRPLPPSPPPLVQSTPPPAATPRPQLTLPPLPPPVTQAPPTTRPSQLPPLPEVAPPPTLPPVAALPQQRAPDPSQLPPLPQTPPSSQPPTTSTAPSQPRRPSAASQLGGPVATNSTGSGGTSTESLINPSQSATGAPSVAARADIDWGPYMSRLKRKVEQHWIPGISETSQRTVLLFSIGRNGNLSNLRVARSSGNEQVDRAALNAVSQSVPFEPLPAAYTRSNVEIEFTFDVGILGSGLSIQ